MYRIRYCVECDEETDAVLLSNNRIECAVCGTSYDEEDVYNLEVMEDMYKLYLGAKSAGWLGNEED